MALTPAQLKTSFYNILYSSTAAASVAVRAALGNGASSVIMREDINKALPAAPFLAFQWSGQASGGTRNRGVRTFYPVWFLYDDSLHRYSRIEALIPLIEAAYPEDAIAMCYVDFEPVRELTDAGLTMPAKSMLFKVKTRG